MNGWIWGSWPIPWISINLCNCRPDCLRNRIEIFHLNWEFLVVGRWVGTSAVQSGHSSHSTTVASENINQLLLYNLYLYQYLHHSLYAKKNHQYYSVAHQACVSTPNYKPQNFLPHCQMRSICHWQYIYPGPTILGKYSIYFLPWLGHAQHIRATRTPRHWFTIDVC